MICVDCFLSSGIHSQQKQTLPSASILQSIFGKEEDKSAQVDGRSRRCNEFLQLVLFVEILITDTTHCFIFARGTFC